MAKYLDCDPLVEEMSGYKGGGEDFDDGIETAISVCAVFPPADVLPVVYGKWIKLDMHKGMEQYKCSVCRSECYVPECMGEPMYAYCPNCGARMEAEDEDMKIEETPDGFAVDIGNAAREEIQRVSYKDRKTAELWTAYTGYAFDPHTVKIMCELRDIVEGDAVTRSLMKEDEDEAD